MLLHRLEEKKLWAGRILQISYCSVFTHIWLIFNYFILFALKSKASSVPQFVHFLEIKFLSQTLAVGIKIL